MSCAANRSCQASLTPPSTTLEMAASATLKICEQRAFQAEEILSMLKRQLQLITSHTGQLKSCIYYFSIALLIHSNVHLILVL